ncbi:MAG: DUF2939 domain-containing protein [Novosphingobium sp.]|nr:DUF2939 domain-containing protein [Novosphingobium sp.]
MSRKMIAGLLAVLFVAAAASWYFASPSYAMMQMRDAAVAGDADGLRDSIDFPTVREGLKADLRAELVKDVANDKADGAKAFGSMIAMAMVDSLIDGFVTPESIEAMIKSGKFKQPGTQNDVSDEKQPDWSIERDGLSRFTATPDAPEGDKVPSLVFERDGLGWKVTRIKLPEGGLGAPES